MRNILIVSILLASLPALFQCSLTKSSTTEIYKSENTIITSNELGEIYLEAISNSYEYMFDDAKSIDINGKYVGEFKAGFKGLFLYSGLKDALSKLMYDRESDVSDFYGLSVYKNFSGGKELFTTGEEYFYSWDEGEVVPFHSYNPEIIKWGVKNLIPSPKTKIGDKTAQQVYDVVFKRFCRLMVESYTYLEQNDFQKEADQYQSLMNVDQFDGLSYLSGKFQDALTSYNYTDDYSSLQPHMALGFWLRRRLDNTDNEFLEGFTKILSMYDNEWFKKLNSAN